MTNQEAIEILKTAKPANYGNYRPEEQDMYYEDSTELNEAVNVVKNLVNDAEKYEWRDLSKEKPEAGMLVLLTDGYIYCSGKTRECIAGIGVEMTLHCHKSEREKFMAMYLEETDFTHWKLIKPMPEEKK